MQRVYGKMRPFATVALSYLLILLIPFTFSCALYTQAERQLKAQQQTYAHATLVQARDMADSLLHSAQEELLDLARNERVVNAAMLRNPLDKDSYYDLYLLVKATSKMQADRYDLIQSLFIHFFQIDRVCTMTSLFPQSVFYQTACGMTSLQQQRFTERLEEHAYYLTYLEEQTPFPDAPVQKQVICLQSLPMYSTDPRAVICMTLDVSVLERLLADVSANHAGCVAITDPAGTIIAAVGNADLIPVSRLAAEPGETHSTFRHDGVTFSVSTVFSAQTDWAYVSIAPEARVIAAVEDLRHFAMPFLLLGILLGLCLILLFTRRQQRPLVRLSQLVLLNDAAAGDSGGDVRQITRQVERLLAHNRALHNRIANVEVQARAQSLLWDNCKETLKETLLFKLLTCAPDDVYQYVDHLGALHVDFPFSFSLVILSEVPAFLPDSETVNSDGTVAYTCTDMQGRFCTILHFAEEELPRICSGLTAQLEAEHAGAAFGISSIHDDLKALSDAYREASVSLNYCYMRSDRAVRFDLIEKEQAYYVFPIEKERQLIGSICAGNEAEALEQLDALVDANMNKRVLSLSMIRSFMFDIATTLQRAAQTQGEQGVLETIEPERYHTFAVFYADVKDAVGQMCRFSQDKKRSRNSRLKNDILEDIQRNCTNPELSVTYLAEKQGISASYLSHFFHEQTGGTLLDHINRTRIEASREYLLHSSRSIGEIARLLGYADDSSFSRVFRKYMHMSPSAYRKENEVSAGEAQREEGERTPT